MARLFAIAFTLALHVAALLLITGNWRPFAATPGERKPPPAATPRAHRALPAETIAAVVDWTRAPATPATSVRRDATDVRVVVDLEEARRAGRLHADRHVDAIRRMRQRQYGDAIAALLDAPVAQGWPALEQLAREGDGVAADALLEKAARCEEIPTRGATYERFADEAARGLDAVAAAYVRAALEREFAILDREARDCRAGGFGTPRLEMLLRERGVAPRRGEGGVTDVWRQFREAFDAQSRPAYPGPFGDALERLGMDELAADDWITLFAAADSDPAVAYAMGYCLLRTCSNMPELPATERTRLLRASADAGNVHAARALAEDFANGGDLGSAYGWMLFARWADANGCNPVATTLDLADTLRGIASLEAVLTAGQRSSGEVLAAALIARNAAGARAIWSCPG
ncbi:MAG TPA: hypothetical protein VFL14_16230 [Xanthomonadales bacterium]|nr:hypothetical protein [Xanthomonadales bacterium]